jgi:hypothetical protein
MVSCGGPTTLSEVRYEGEAETKKLAEELRNLETKEDVLKAIPVLKKRFHKIADLLVIAKAFPKEESEPSFASEQLFAELARLYEIPGCKELIESAQIEAARKIQ